MAVTHMSCCLKYPCMYKADVKLSYSCLCQVNGVKQVDGKYHMLYFEEPKQDKKNFREIKIRNLIKSILFKSLKQIHVGKRVTFTSLLSNKTY